MKNRPEVSISPGTAPWTRCANCDDFHCTIHNEHVADCACPPIDMWLDYGLDPYESVPEDMQLCLQAMLRTAAQLGEDYFDGSAPFNPGDPSEEHF